MRVFNRNRLIATGLVAAFLAAFFAIGAVSRPSPTTAGATAGGAVPSSPWYWAMAVSPADADVLLLATSNGLFRSSDAGRTWRPTGPKGVHATSLVDAGRAIFVGGVQTKNPSPVIRKGSDRVAPDGQAVLAVSKDGGKTWQVLHPRGLPNVAVQTLVVDPANSSALYALLNTGGLYRSTDGARSFQRVSSKLGVPPWALAITDGGEYVAGNMDSGHYVSPNGKAWQRTPYTDSRGDRHVMAFAVQPTDSSHVLMTSRGVEMSTDGGRTWHVKLKSDVMFGPVAWVPSEPDVAYAVGFDQSLWRSDDGGESWKKVS